jgi:putative transposase
MYPTDLTDVQWELLQALIPPQSGRGRRRWIDLRRIVNGLLYLDRTGCQWRMLPKEYGPWTTVRYYFDKWTSDGTFQRMNAALREQVRVQAGRDPQPSGAILDSQSAKTSQVGGERGYDGGKKGLGSQAAHFGRHDGQSLGDQGAPRRPLGP